MSLRRSFEYSMWSKPLTQGEQKVERLDSKLQLDEKLNYVIPRLHVIDGIVEAVSPFIKEKLRKAIVVGCQHNLETTATLYRAIKALGVKKIYSVGKCYSDSEIIQRIMRADGVSLMPSSKPAKAGEFQLASRQDIRQMWEAVLEEMSSDIETIIVLDDGGRLLEEMPAFARLNYNVAGIEQTRGGLYSPELDRLPFPVIEVASSALKREIEPKFIVSAVISVLRKKLDHILNSLNLNKRTVFGVIGNGAIGSAVAKYLLELGYTVAAYDENDQAFQSVMPRDKLFRMSTPAALIANAQCIFGCTGKDFLAKIPVHEIVSKDTLFISCTSEDREFLSLLQVAQDKRVMITDPLSNIVLLSNNGSKIIIARGGYPLNFDGEPWNVPADQIEPTQGALLGAVIQAAICAKHPINDGVTKNCSERLMLHADIQRLIVNIWKCGEASKHHSKKLLDCFDDPVWIEKNSGGQPFKSGLLTHCFSVRAHEATLTREEIRASPIRSRL